MFRLSTRYAPRDLVPTSRAGLGGSHRVRAFVVDDLRAMAAAARRAGAPLAIVSAYRRYSTQVSVFGSWSRLIGRPAALLVSARPGHSEHQLGTTIDFTNLGGGKPWRVRDWGWTKAGAWLARNAWKYGFVMSYPKGKTTVTCYTYEPWHYRYVGRRLAKQVHDSQLTLREFLWARQTPVAPVPVAPVTPSPRPSVEPTPSETTS
jgi:D-alanyl-D-alanine carboxypeptidase